MIDDPISKNAKEMWLAREHEVETMRRLTKPRGFLYLATPYTNYEVGRDAAARHAAFVASALTELGVAVYSPIVHWHEVDKYGWLGEDPEFWFQTNIPILSAAKGVVVCHLPGWHESIGINKEIKFAKDCFIPVMHLLLPDVFYTH